MRETDELNFNLIKHILGNIIILISIFLFFGLFVSFMVRNLIYVNVDTELMSCKEQILEITNIKNQLYDSLYSPKFDLESPLSSLFEEARDLNLIKKIVNPDINVIIRNKDGVIVAEEMGRIEEYSDEITFNKNYIDKIYEVTIAKMYHYRGINIFLDAENPNNDRYVQLLVNVNSERYLINSYMKIIIPTIIFCLILSIIASYILTKRTLKPLKDNILKQTEFVQNVSHELRTPLTIIQAKQELLLQEPNSKIIDKSEDIALTLNETKRLSKLVKDLLIISRADNSKLNLQKESINISEYMKEIVNPYIEIAEIENKKIIYDFKYTADINLDTNRFYQLIIILLDNAIKYTEAGDEIIISIFEKDNKCYIEIKDTGIGVSDKGLTRIFERFYREDEARNRESGGTGLGLAIAKIIVNEHGGTIKASHNNPKGTIFTIKLPK